MCLYFFRHIDVMEFPHTMLMSGTDNFSSVNAIGEGGFGKVFRGRVYHCDVAIKLLSDVSTFLRMTHLQNEDSPCLYLTMLIFHC